MNEVFKNVSEWLLSIVTTVSIAGGLGILVYKHYFLNRQQRHDAQSELIETLQKLTFDSMDKMTALQKDLDYWRREYNEQGKTTRDLQKNYEQAMHENEQLKKSVDKLTRQYQELKGKYDQLIQKS